MRQDFERELTEMMGEGQVHKQEPMSRHTTFRIGGPAEYFVTPRTAQLPALLALCDSHQVPYTLIGNGSNVLVGDGGIPGLVIELLAKQEKPRVEGARVTAGAGVLLSRTAAAAAEAGLGGMEFAAGIPGTLGGAVVMNAGAYGGEMKDIIERVSVLTRRGERQSLTVLELDLGYRHSCIEERGYIITEITLHLEQKRVEAIRAQMEELKAKRVEKQPLEYPSAGSTFKRPDGYYAGKLIMDAGLRGFQVGGAKVSEKHCGFVVNTGGATAADVCKLMREVSERVWQQFGVVLEPEVKRIGIFD